MNAYEGMKPMLEKIGRGEKLTVEERTEFDNRNQAITDLEADIRSAEQAEELAAKFRDERSIPEAPANTGEVREEAFRSYLRTGAVSPELRAMGEGTLNPASATGAGYLVPPGWFQRLQVALKVYGGMARDFEQLETESGQSLQWATTDPTSIVGQLVGGQTSPPANTASSSGSGNENTQIQDVDYTFGQGTLSAYMYTSGVQKVSMQLANDSAFDIDAFVNARVAESLGRAQANSVVNGTGSSQPLGIYPALSGKGAVAVGDGGSGGVFQLTGSANVVLDGADAVTEVAANTLAPSTLRSMIACVDPAYRALGAKFYMSDAQLLGMRGQTDKNGRPLINLQDGLTPGAPTTLWGYEVVVDNNIPALSATGTPGGATAGVGGPVFGHLSTAMILRTVTQAGILRLDQRYADLLQIGYIGYMRYDHRSNDLRAAVTVSAAASSGS